MSSIPPPHRGDPDPPSASERTGRSDVPANRRPRYLVVALIGALIFGSGCMSDGCQRLAFYRGEREHHVRLNAAIRDEGDRAHAESLYQRFVDVAYDAQGRAIPMAAATFVLGMALLAFAARGLGGRANTRSALMQVIAAQAIVVAASYYVTRDVRSAELDWELERYLIQQHETATPEQYEAATQSLRIYRHYGPPGWLAFRTLASALILFALSRPRSREFFDAAARTVPER